MGPQTMARWDSGCSELAVQKGCAAMAHSLHSEFVASVVLFSQPSCPAENKQPHGPHRAWAYLPSSINHESLQETISLLSTGLIQGSQSPFYLPTYPAQGQKLSFVGPGAEQMGPQFAYPGRGGRGSHTPVCHPGQGILWHSTSWMPAVARRGTSHQQVSDSPQIPVRLGFHFLGL